MSIGLGIGLVLLAVVAGGLVFYAVSTFTDGDDDPYEGDEWLGR